MSKPRFTTQQMAAAGIIAAIYAALTLRKPRRYICWWKQGSWIMHK